MTTGRFVSSNPAKRRLLAAVCLSLLAATRCAWGAVIEKIDAAPPALIADPVYRATHMRWLSPALRDTLARQINEFYRFRSKPGRTNIKP